MIRIADQGESLVGSNPVQIATGLRNAAGMTFHPLTGDLYVQDNGIDGVVVAIEPTSADEINFLPAAEIGGTIEDFAFFVDLPRVTQSATVPEPTSAALAVILLPLIGPFLDRRIDAF